MSIKEESLKAHGEWKGKLEVVSRVKVENKDDLSIAYSPGVAEPCMAIHNDVSLSYVYTRRWNTVAVITDGTAVLGLGDIGPEAGMPVMEGKCVLFKTFADVDAIPLCIRSKDVDEIVNTVRLLAGSFGGVNLEDISAPRCFEIERRLKEECDIPVFHDDQHGTAIVVLAAIINALKVAQKDIGAIKLVISGAGSAGISIAKLLLKAGLKNAILVDLKGALCVGEEWMNPAQKEIAEVTNPDRRRGSLKDVIKGADVFIGVSAPGIVSKDMVASMNKGAVVFGMANPVPEIMPDEAREAGALIAGSGRSDCANQVNNLLAFPGIFRGALDVRASEINEEMKLAASRAIAGLISDDELNADYVIPSPFDKRVARAVADAVAKAARETGVARI